MPLGTRAIEPFQRHAQLSAIAKRLLAIPGFRAATRAVLRVALQQWPLPHGVKQRLFNFFADEVAPSGVLACRIPAGPRKLDLELQLDDDLSRNWYFWGYAGFEPGMSRLFQRLLDSRRIIFDVGANVGYYTLLAASLVQDGGAVYAFEPAPAVFAGLLRNAQLNDYKCLRVHQLALSDVDGQGYLFVADGGLGTNASLVPGFAHTTSAVTVPMMRFDSFCAAHSVERVDLVKVDVEGAELAMLHGMGALLHRWRPDIIIEVLEPFASEIDSFFAGTEYRKFLITNAGLRAMDSIKADAVFRDVYLTCSAEAIRV